MRSPMLLRLHEMLERRLPERRLFIKSEVDTRFIRLRPETQLLAWAGAIVVVGWAIVATAVVIFDSIGSGNFRAQAERDQILYEARLRDMAEERDARAAEALAAQERFASALSHASDMQRDLLDAQTRARELEQGIGGVREALRRSIAAREEAEAELASTLVRLDADATAQAFARGDEADATVDMMTDLLGRTATERDVIASDAEFALEHASEMELELRLLQDKNDQIFRQLEEAMNVSLSPLDDMFRQAGMNPDDLLRAVRRGYSGTGGPLTPMQFSTRGDGPDPDAARANDILGALDRINLYRIAAERAPFAMPVRDSFRFTSGFGPRWGRMHNGTDFAAPIGTPIYSTADGVVTFAGWSSGYGRLIKIQHEFGIETRYAHLNRIRVNVGQRVSRGERIGDMGNSGRSTGPHLHYEVRVGGRAVNPMIYIRAGQDVF
ncbi:MAG: DUF5930 domain-containing protein [Paracoccaceae bacterium]